MIYVQVLSDSDMIQDLVARNWPYEAAEALIKYLNADDSDTYSVWDPIAVHCAYSYQTVTEYAIANLDPEDYGYESDDQESDRWYSDNIDWDCVEEDIRGEHFIANGYVISYN